MKRDELVTHQGYVVAVEPDPYPGAIGPKPRTMMTVQTGPIENSRYIGVIIYLTETEAKRLALMLMSDGAIGGNVEDGLRIS